MAGEPGGWPGVSLTGGGAAYRDGQGRTRCRRCDKIVYAGEEEAQAAADAARAERVLLRAYREPACGYWHLTSRAELPLQAQQEERARQRERERAEGGRNWQWILVALVAVVVVAVAVSAFLFDRLGGDDPEPPPPVTATPVAATSVPTSTATPTPAATAAPARTPTATPSPTATPPPTPVPTPDPVVVWTIGNTDGTGVALRDDCADEARYSARGEGWADNTRVELIEEGADRCEGWLRVETDDEVSWVRREYLIRRALSSTWTVGNTGAWAWRCAATASTRRAAPSPARAGSTTRRCACSEVGEGRCAGWLRVELGGLESWVRERFLIEVVEPAALEAWTIGNTGGSGVALRDDCLDDARVSEQGEGWRDDTRVELVETGAGRCAGWLRVESGGVASWVREDFLVPEQ